MSVAHGFAIAHGFALALAAAVVTQRGIEGIGAVGVRKRGSDVPVSKGDLWHRAGLEKDLEWSSFAGRGPVSEQRLEALKRALSRRPRSPPGSAYLYSNSGLRSGRRRAPSPKNGPEADNPSVLGPAGTVHASLEDWARFVADLLRGTSGEGGILRREGHRQSGRGAHPLVARTRVSAAVLRPPLQDAVDVHGEILLERTDSR